MSRIFMIADTHFGHPNVIKYEKRPFRDVEEMDSTLVKNWNSVVKSRDKVFLLGDFSFYNKEKSSEICKALNGHKTLIMGNHDDKSPNYYMDCGFDSVSKYPVIFDEYWILSHEPKYVNDSMPYANIFGHVHANKQYRDYSASGFCVSVERIDYTPIDFERIKQAVMEENNNET